MTRLLDGHPPLWLLDEGSGGGKESGIEHSVYVVCVVCELKLGIGKIIIVEEKNKQPQKKNCEKIKPEKMNHENISRKKKCIHDSQKIDVCVF